jgi:hypothetical protein
MHMKAVLLCHLGGNQRSCAQLCCAMCCCLLHKKKRMHLSTYCYLQDRFATSCNKLHFYHIYMCYAGRAEVARLTLAIGKIEHEVRVRLQHSKLHAPGGAAAALAASSRPFIPSNVAATAVQPIQLQRIILTASMAGAYHHCL